MNCREAELITMAHRLSPAQYHHFIVVLTCMAALKEDTKEYAEFQADINDVMSGGKELELFASKWERYLNTAQ